MNLVSSYLHIGVKIHANSFNRISEEFGRKEEVYISVRSSEQSLRVRR